MKELHTSLIQEHHLPTVGQMLELPVKQGRSFKKTSAYRAIEQLQNEGVICQHFFYKNQATYEFREHHHAHHACGKCGRNEIAECLYNQPKTVNFHITRHQLTLMGGSGGCKRQTFNRSSFVERL